MKRYTKEEAIKIAKKMISDKQEVVRWMRSSESYASLINKGISLGKIGQ